MKRPVQFAYEHARSMVPVAAAMALLMALLIVVVSAMAVAGNRSGTVSGEFLKLPLSARAVGMGGAQVAVARGVEAIAFNAAGITSVADYGFSAGYTQWFANIQY